MNKYAPQIFPAFTDVIALDDNIQDKYTFIRNHESIDRFSLFHETKKYAYLIDEDSSLHDFINMLGEREDNSQETSPLDLYSLHIARNIIFPEGSVRLVNELCIEQYHINDMAELLTYIVRSKAKYLQHAVFIKPVWPLTGQDISSLRLAILQQFVYLRMYIPVIIANDYRTADRVFRGILHGTGDTKHLAVTGTKKAGKTALINAMLGDIYSPSSSELPTPCAITYSLGKNLAIEQEGNTQTFSKAGDMSRYILDEFSRADKAKIIPGNMSITLQKYPEKLSGITITDTPGTNFAGDSGHRQAAYSSVERADFCLFVVNYSSHLADDEAELFASVYNTFNNQERNRIVIIAVNRIDEMYASSVVKSYERAADYISSRLKSLGYDNFIVVPVSALTSLHAIMKDTGNPFIRNVIQNKKDFHGFELKAIRDVEHAGRVKYLTHIISSLMRQGV